jgi:hypothetical protein
MARFDEERRLLLERYEALDAENAELRGALLAAQHRAEEAAFTADQLRGNLERSRALGLAVRGAGEQGRGFGGGWGARRRRTWVVV